MLQINSPNYLKPLNLKLTSPKLFIDEDGRAMDGRWTDIYLAEGLDDLYARKGLCLKVFKHSREMKKSCPKWGWGTRNIEECSVIQNLFAQKGLAPRVYDLVRVKEEVTQVTDYLKPKEMKLMDLPPDDRFENSRLGINCTDFLNGKLVDFQGFTFKDFKRHRQKVRDRVAKGFSTGAGFPVGYQSADYQGGQRDTKNRLEKYELEDMRGKTVLDLGCSLGMFSRAASDLGAKRVVGIDTKKAIELVEELSYLDGYFNIDFYGLDLSKVKWEDIEKLTGIKRFDVILSFAVSRYMGMPDWIYNCDTLYFEGHGTSERMEREFYKMDCRHNKKKIIRRFFWDN